MVRVRAREQKQNNQNPGPIPPGAGVRRPFDFRENLRPYEGSNNQQKNRIWGLGNGSSGRPVGPRPAILAHIKLLVNT